MPTRGARLAAKRVMPEFSVPEIVAEFLFGSIGFVAFIYGKRMQVWTPMFIGLALMVYPYFVPNPLVSYAAGTILTAALFLFRG
jgi:hypothetical protein